MEEGSLLLAHEGEREKVKFESNMVKLFRLSGSDCSSYEGERVVKVGVIA